MLSKIYDEISTKMIYKNMPKNSWRKLHALKLNTRLDT